MGTAAFVAFLMSLCNRRYTATQYALLSSLAALGRVFIAPTSGYVVESIGWADFFLRRRGHGAPRASACLAPAPDYCQDGGQQPQPGGS